MYYSKQTQLQIQGKNYPYKCHIIQLEESITNTSLQILDLKKQLRKILLPIKTILFIVNDATRPTQTAFILKNILPLCKEKKLQFIIATGTHNKPKEKDLEQIFGATLPEILPHLVFHDARSEESLYLGKTSFGNNIFVNPILSDCELIITINSVEPHYFAGFTGGRKSILPGIAVYETIENNHQLAMNEKASNLNLSDNPVHLDMEEGVSFIKTPVFSIQLVQDWQQKIQHLSFGTLKESFYQAVEIARTVYTVQVPKKADIIVAEVEKPLNKNFYQAHKALENCRILLKKGGIFILVAACQEGIGNSQFVETLNEFQTISEVMHNSRKKYRLGVHKTYRIASFLQESQFWLVSELQGQIIKQHNFQNIQNFSTAMQAAIKEKGKDCTIFRIRQAGSIAPIFVG